MKKPSTWIIIILSIMLFLFFVENRSFSAEIDQLNAEIKELHKECDRQYEEGYENGREQEAIENGSYYSGSYYTIEDMSDEEVIEHLENRLSDTVWVGEEARNFAIYTFQLGYNTRKNGVWDEVTEELMNGYVFTNSDIARFSRLLQ